MEVRWNTEAKQDFFNTLDYWEEHNASFEYSLKIMQAVKTLELELAETPYFLAKYSNKLKLYRRHFLKGKFVIYYDVLEEQNVVIIQFFRSSKQISDDIFSEDHKEENILQRKSFFAKLFSTN